MGLMDNLKKEMVKLKGKAADLINYEFASMVTDKGELFYDGDIEVGKEVYLKDEDGNNILPEDGIYTSNDKVLTVENGIVIEIVDSQSGIVEEELEDINGEEVPDEVTVEYVPVEVFNQLLSVVEELVKEVEMLKGNVDSVEEEFSKLKVTPKKNPITTTPTDNKYKKQNKVEDTSDRFFNGWKQ